ncbi:MAG: SH3 domain-containing protein [Rhodobiaceae bacterium]|jgi:SH3-like domain-containing protein|nr:SH3 domain-containing protein [Rhodobiaceae bacterium]
MNRLWIVRLSLGLVLLISVVSLVPFSISAQDSRDTRPLGDSGLPLPRFVSINKSEANMRRGPGEDYPLLFQYQRRGLPLEIIAEYGQWRQVRDHEGSEGWMHARLLRGNRTVMLRQAANALILRQRPDMGAGVVALGQSGAIGRLEECEGDWCEIDLGGHEGWVQRDMLWGVYRFEFND